ncbi:hypothetical protein EYF80_041974 [Liparis tanakae]|uniref:Uncharacterized protein n=1 Tax=Liparis tanakae TaxID=230148 RepID=A0A4Z2G3E7_9TELE|nr:hypothetical protein EYF80_041974 [Liparis tanakae]
MASEEELTELFVVAGGGRVCDAVEVVGPAGGTSGVQDGAPSGPPGLRDSGPPGHRARDVSTSSLTERSGSAVRGARKSKRPFSKVFIVISSRDASSRRHRFLILFHCRPLNTHFSGSRQGKRYVPFNSVL